MKTCKHCSCSGIYVGYDPRVQGGGIMLDCSHCNGRGWVDDDGAKLPKLRTGYATIPVSTTIATQR